MLRELVNEIVELLNESDVKDTQINELRAEVEGLKVQIAQLKQELEIANNSIVELNNEVISEVLFRMTGEIHPIQETNYDDKAYEIIIK